MSYHRLSIKFYIIERGRERERREERRERERERVCVMTLFRK